MLDCKCEISDLKDQIDGCLSKAIDILLDETLLKDLDSNKIDWVIEILKETILRMNSLTPHRKDLHVDLENVVDIEVIRKTMILENVENVYVTNLINAVYDRLLLLCAPVQDFEIRNQKEICKCKKNVSEKIWFLLSTCNKDINEIERLLTKNTM